MRAAVNNSYPPFQVNSEKLIKSLLPLPSIMRTIKCGGATHELPKSSGNPPLLVEVGAGGNEVRKGAMMPLNRSCPR